VWLYEDLQTATRTTSCVRVSLNNKLISIVDPSGLVAEKDHFPNNSEQLWKYS